MLGALIGGLISGAGSLLSGLGAKESAEDQQARQEAYDAAARERVTEVTEKYRKNVPSWVVQDAEKAGFNPVTWLNGGGLGWYGTQLSGLVSSYGQATQAINIPSAMSAVGGAISAGYGAFAQQNQFDQKMALENAYFGMQANRYTPGSMGAAHPFADKLWAAAGGYTAGGRTEWATPVMASAANPKVTSPWAGVGYHSDPVSPDAQDVQTRGGDVMENAAGLYNTFIADPIYNATGMSLTRGIGSAGNWVMKTFGGSKPTPTDMNDLFSGDLSRTWKFFTRNTPDYMAPLRNPMVKGGEPVPHNYGGM